MQGDRTDHPPSSLLTGTNELGGTIVRTGHIADLRAQIGSDLLLQPAVSACILDDQRRPLLARHADDGTWSFPGGAVEPLESPADAIVREVSEELGVPVTPRAVVAVTGGPMFVIQYPNGDRTSYVGTMFHCHVDDGIPTPDLEELLEVRHVTRDQALALPLHPWMDMALPLVFGWLDDGITRFAPANDADQPHATTPNAATPQP